MGRKLAILGLVASFGCNAPGSTSGGGDALGGDGASSPQAAQWACGTVLPGIQLRCVSESMGEQIVADNDPRTLSGSDTATTVEYLASPCGLDGNGCGGTRVWQRFTASCELAPDATAATAVLHIETARQCGSDKYGSGSVSAAAWTWPVALPDAKRSYHIQVDVDAGDWTVNPKHPCYVRIGETALQIASTTTETFSQDLTGGQTVNVGIDCQADPESYMSADGCYGGCYPPGSDEPVSPQSRDDRYVFHLSATAK